MQDLTNLDDVPLASAAVIATGATGTSSSRLPGGKYLKRSEGRRSGRGGRRDYSASVNRSLGSSGGSAEGENHDRSHGGYAHAHSNQAYLQMSAESSTSLLGLQNVIVNAGNSPPMAAAAVAATAARLTPPPVAPVAPPRVRLRPALSASYFNQKPAYTIAGTATPIDSPVLGAPPPQQHAAAASLGGEEVGSVELFGGQGVSYFRRRASTEDGAVLTPAAHVHSLSSPARAQRVQRSSREATPGMGSESGSTNSDEYTDESSEESSYSYSDTSTGAVPAHSASPSRDRTASEARPSSRQQSGRLALRWSETETAF